MARHNRQATGPMLANKESTTTVRSIGAMKASGPDGITALFFHSFWNIVKQDVIGAIQNFFTSGFLLKALNHTNIVLIPKRDNPTLTSHFRPISLCNVIYKIISKILAACLKPLLQKLISPMQAGFVPNCLIQENTILAHEIVHKLKLQKGKKGLMALKIDMEKAYDCFEWDFIFKVLRSFGFSATWIQLIHQCLTTVSYSLLLNGSPHGFFFS